MPACTQCTSQSYLLPFVCNEGAAGTRDALEQQPLALVGPEDGQEVVTLMGNKSKQMNTER